MRGKKTECVTMRGKLLIAAALAVAATSFVSAPTKAAVLYDNLLASSAGSDSVAGSGPLYDSFSTGASTFSFNSLKLLLEGGGGNLTVGLYANTIGGPGPNAGSSLPGSLIQTLATLSSVPVAPSIVTLNSFTINLSANTRYWIGLSGGHSLAEWLFSFDTTGTGVANEFSFSSANGLLPNNPDGAYQMQVSGANTPLPAALPLFA